MSTPLIRILLRNSRDLPSWCLLKLLIQISNSNVALSVPRLITRSFDWTLEATSGVGGCKASLFPPHSWRRVISLQYSSPPSFLNERCAVPRCRLAGPFPECRISSVTTMIPHVRKVTLMQISMPLELGELNHG